MGQKELPTYLTVLFHPPLSQTFLESDNIFPGHSKMAENRPASVVAVVAVADVAVAKKPCLFIPEGENKEEAKVTQVAKQISAVETSF
jgi:hypothetical protein